MIAASGPDLGGQDVEVILHVGDRHVIELEVWAGSRQTELPAIANLRHRD